MKVMFAVLMAGMACIGVVRDQDPHVEARLAQGPPLVVELRVTNRSERADIFSTGRDVFSLESRAADNCYRRRSGFLSR